MSGLVDIRATKHTDACLAAEMRLAACALRGTPGDLRALWSSGLNPEWITSGFCRAVIIECRRAFDEVGSTHEAIPVLVEWIGQERVDRIWVECGAASTGRHDVEILRRHHHKLAKMPLPPQSSKTTQLRERIRSWRPTPAT